MRAWSRRTTASQAIRAAISEASDSDGPRSMAAIAPLDHEVFFVNWLIQIRFDTHREDIRGHGPRSTGTEKTRSQQVRDNGLVSGETASW